MPAHAYDTLPPPSRVEGADRTIGRLLAGGALAWGLYSVLYVIVKGVVLDEALVPAQIITGTAAYPEGHPHLLYYLKAYSLPNYLTAGLWALIPSPTLHFALRNILFLFLSAYVPFAMATVLSRQALWGYVAAALTLTETFVAFEGVYPMWVFPIYYSHGHIGLHLALLCVVLFLAGLWRTGGGLFGLLPSLHLSMALIAWPWCGLFVLAERRHLRGHDWKHLLLTAGLGLVACAALAALIAWRTAGVETPTLTEAQAADASFIYRHFTAWTDVHSQAFSLRSFAYVINPVAFFVIGALLLASLDRPAGDTSTSVARRNVVWILLLGGFVWAVVYGSWLYQTLIGPLPFVINAPRPFRFSNITALLLVPLTVAGIASVRKQLADGTQRLATLLIAGVILVAALYMLVSKENGHTYLVLMAAWGVFFALYLFAFRRDGRRRTYGLLGLFILGGLILFASLPQNYRIAAVLALSFFGTLAVFLVGAKRPVMTAASWRTRISALLLGTCAFLVAVTLVDTSLWDWRHFLRDAQGAPLTKWDSFSSFDAEVVDWLETHATPDEMILTPVYPRSEVQVKTGHPVLFEPETMWLLTYMPDLAPPINTMTRDLYGLDYSNPDQLRQYGRDGHISINDPFWREIWKQRTREAWQALGKKYEFRLVLSPPNMPLDLSVALENPLWTLYVIP